MVSAIKIPHMGTLAVWDDPEGAEALAAEMNAICKHAKNKFPQDERWWKTFSVIVPR